MSNTPKTSSITIKYPYVLTLLGVLFIGLKLAGQIDWSWWWVLAPFWAPWAIVFAIPLFLAAVVGIVLFLSWVFDI